MRTPLVVIHPPLLAHTSRLFQTDEPVLAQALVAELPVEALDEGVLHRLARVDEAQGDAALSRPLIHRLAHELRPVVPSKVRLSRSVLLSVWCFCQEDTQRRRTEHDSFALYINAARPGSHRRRQAQA